MTPKEILSQLAARYSEAPAYLDTGEVTAAFSTGTQDKVSFGTAFSRSGGFRFWFRRAASVQVIEKLDAGVLAMSTGTSLGAAFTIPRLLVTTLRGWCVTDLASLKTANTQTVDGIECFSIEGQHPSTNSTFFRLQITHKELLLKQVQKTANLAHGQTVVQIATYNSTIDPKMSWDEMLARSSY